MNLYIDESGTINNIRDDKNNFIITIVQVLDKRKLDKLYKHFIRKNFNKLKELDRVNNKKPTNKMFKNGTFKELKGSKFDRNLKIDFLKLFYEIPPIVKVFYIVINNNELTNDFCSNSARAFNYLLKSDIFYLIKNKLLPVETYNIQLDERNEKTNTRHFLQEYLNIELLNSNFKRNDNICKFTVQYLDSSNSKYIQIADIFSNIKYSNLLTSAYDAHFETLKKNGIVAHEFIFPPKTSN